MTFSPLSANERRSHSWGRDWGAALRALYLEESRDSGAPSRRPTSEGWRLRPCVFLVVCAIGWGLLIVSVNLSLNLSSDKITISKALAAWSGDKATVVKSPG